MRHTSKAGKIFRIKAVALSVIAATAISLALNTEVSIHYGINGRYSVIKMPLYVKWTQFLARHYEYARLAREITSGKKGDEEKTLAILEWTRDNLKDIPPGMPVCDDHILNIIIRGYAVPEQFQEVFTTLCSYSGVQAFYEKVYDCEHRKKYIISYVKIAGKWRPFDAHTGIYFKNHMNHIASVEDIASDRSLIDKAGIDNIFIEGIPYKEFFLNLKPVTGPMTLRAQKQMPFHRILYEMRKALKIEKAEEDTE
jgi:hypothetical protein